MGSHIFLAHHDMGNETIVNAPNNADNDNDMSMLPCHLAVLSTTEQLTMIDRAVVNCLNPYMVYQLVMIL